jgi:1-acyl-sn-glycerol-3-phosphate acyltransferase
MQLTIPMLATLPTGLVRSALPAWVASHLDVPVPEQAALAASLAEIVAGVSDGEITAMQQAFARPGDGWCLHPADPLARRITRAYMSTVAQPWRLEGGEHLTAFLNSDLPRRMVVCNHLSYTDTQLTDAVLALAGHAAFADRLVAVAGPKVYTETWRRMAAIALNTRKTAQSSGVASEQAALTPRELAAIAFDTLADCERLMDEGYVVLLYPEGTRARDGRLQPFLRAAARYLAIPQVQVLPLAQSGGDAVFPHGATVMQRHATTLRFGAPLRPADFSGKLGGLEATHAAVRALLPPAHQPDAAQPAVS